MPGVAFVNLVNNLLPLLIIFPIAASFGLEQILEAVGDVRNVWLAGLIQLVAYAFSLAFRKLTIPQVIVFSKLPDLLIPLGIYALSGVWSFIDFAFSALTTVVCLPLLLTRDHSRVDYKGQGWVLVFLMGAVLLRGVFSGALVQGQGSYRDVWLLVTAATLWWRFIWTLLVTLGSVLIQGKPSWTSPGTALLIGWAGITLAVQALYVLALATGPTTAVWPIINSTALFSTVFSAVLLHERPTRHELAAICGIVALTLARMFCRID